MRIRGLGWYLVSAVVAVIPLGALSIEWWHKNSGHWPTPDQLFATGDTFLVAVALAAQGLIDGLRLASGKDVPQNGRNIGIAVCLLSFAAAITSSALWATIEFQVPQDYQRLYRPTAHAGEVVLAAAIFFGGLMSSLREGYEKPRSEKPR
jgi:hypothetical protein